MAVQKSMESPYPTPRVSPDEIPSTVRPPAVLESRPAQVSRGRDWREGSTASLPGNGGEPAWKHPLVHFLLKTAVVSSVCGQY